MGLIEWLRRPQAPPPDEGRDLFDDEFQRKLDYLAVVSRRVFAGRTRAERRTKKSGSGVEFVDYREYSAGDDLRYLDWNLYQRHDKLLLRLFEEEEDLAIHVVVDASSSMGFGGGQKLRQAKRLAAALSYVGLSNLDRVSIAAARGEALEAIPPARGKQRIFPMFEFLRGLKAEGTTDLGAAMKSLVARTQKRRGLAVLLSDLFDPAGFERGINALRFGRFEVVALHLVDPADARPALHGEVRLYDCETGDERDVTVTPRLLERYREAYDAYRHEIESFCASKQVPYFVADASAPFDEIVLRVFRRGGFLR
jgi:uncharacterized protein (DUF58 family)